MSRRRLQAFVSGRVQGVGFRYFVQRTAVEFGVTGWVRNRRDGKVEVLAEGEHSDLARFTAALRRGPPSSSVTEMDMDWADATGEFRGFAIRSTE